MSEPEPADARLAQLERWLATVLDGDVSSPVPASEDASFRRYFRIRSDERSFIVMDAPPALEDCRAFLDILERLRAAGVNAPRAHAVELREGFILLDDLGTECYLDRLDDGCADALYADACTTLARMQTGVAVNGLPAYDHALIRRELELFPEWLLGRHLEIRVSDAARRTLDDAFEALASAFDEQPRVFVHRDYHSRNLMVTETSNPGVIDFQDAVAGPVTYDLVSLLRDVYVEWPQSRVDAWIDRYHDIALDAGVLGAPCREAFRRWFDLTGIQRHVKVAGIFARLFHRDGKARYLGDLPLTLRYLANVAPRYPQTRALGRLVEALGVAERVGERS